MGRALGPQAMSWYWAARRFVMQARFDAGLSPVKPMWDR
jgi:hypothetical protein